MNITTDPAVLTDVEIRRLWNHSENSISQITYFLEEVFKCDRLTAQTVASCVSEANAAQKVSEANAAQKVELELQSLRSLSHSVENTIYDVIGQLRDLL